MESVISAVLNFFESMRAGLYDDDAVIEYKARKGQLFLMGLAAGGWFFLAYLVGGLFQTADAGGPLRIFLPYRETVGFIFIAGFSILILLAGCCSIRMLWLKEKFGGAW